METQLGRSIGFKSDLSLGYQTQDHTEQSVWKETILQLLILLDPFPQHPSNPTLLSYAVVTLGKQGRKGSFRKMNHCGDEEVGRSGPGWEALEIKHKSTSREVSDLLPLG